MNFSKTKILDLKNVEFSNLICFLLSNNSNYINGEDISIDGGWLSS